MQSDSGKLPTVAECPHETQSEPIPAITPLRGPRSGHKSAARYALSRYLAARVGRDNSIEVERACRDLDMGHRRHNRWSMDRLRMVARI